MLATVGLLAMGLSKQLPAHAFCKRSFLGQPSAPETAVLNTRPGAEPMLCSELFSSTPGSRASPFTYLDFGSRTRFCSKITPCPPRLLCAGAVPLALHCCPLLEPPIAAEFREDSATGDNLFLETTKLETLPKTLCCLHGKVGFENGEI